MALDQQKLREYARVGAAARLAALDHERAAILRAFPGLKPVASLNEDDGRVRVTRRRGRRRMSAAARKAVSARMKRYWAARRKETRAKA